MFGALLKDDDTATINTYNVLSGKLIYSRPTNRSIMEVIWTWGKCIQFALLEPTSIITWEAGFASKDPSIEVGSLPLPNNFDPSGEFLFLPTLCRLAFVLGGVVLVWDALHSKFLLDSMDMKTPENMTFSLDGRFFACGSGPKIYLWKESSTGYILHRELISNARERTVLCKPLLSPDGRSIIATYGSTLQLWRTTDSTSPSDVLTQSSKWAEAFILEFSPDRSWAASARLADDVAMVLDLKSSIPRRLIIDTGVKIYGLRVDRNVVIVIGDGRVITWDLPPVDHALDTRVDVNDSVQTTTFDHSPSLEGSLTPSAAISPDLRRIVVVGETMEGGVGLNIYDVSTGKHLAGTALGNAWGQPWFTPDGREIWCDALYGREAGWAIVEDSVSGHFRLEFLESPQCQPEGFPWRPSCGYRVMDNGWVFSPGGKRVFWLAPLLQSDGANVTWSGRFLALLHRILPEAIIMELPDS